VVGEGSLGGSGRRAGSVVAVVKAKAGCSNQQPAAEQPRTSFDGRQVLDPAGVEHHVVQRLDGAAAGGAHTHEALRQQVGGDDLVWFWFGLVGFGWGWVGGLGPRSRGVRGCQWAGFDQTAHNCMQCSDLHACTTSHAHQHPPTPPPDARHPAAATPRTRTRAPPWCTRTRRTAASAPAGWG